MTLKTLQNSNVELLYPLIPPVFALLTMIFSKAENRYFDIQADNIYKARTLSPDMRPLLGAIAKSSASLKNHIVTLTSCFLSILIALHKWADPWRYLMAVMVGVIFLLIFRSWIWKIFSLRLDEMQDRVPKKKRHPNDSAFHTYTYAQLFNKFHIAFNITIVFIVLIGYVLF
jgi:hypothetical protein